MSALPEAELAREAEMSYALIGAATDYDSWRPNSEAVTAAEVFKTLRCNADTARIVAPTILDDLHNVIIGDGSEIFLEEVGKMKYSIMPTSPMQKAGDIT